MLEPTRKGLAVTRSFGRPIMAWREMSEALITYAMRAGEKLREHHVAAQYLTVFFHTSAFADDPWYSDAATGQFLEATTIRRRSCAWRCSRESASGATVTNLPKPECFSMN
jgi:hypothetical protein